ncbi:POU domain, class 6, transcription factor 2-like isoform X2 [Anopheles albimanus]|uniref:POU domain, class 6, transcription factor 2-like isoform X2 n=1 Tax=Anopheles albimanus TaxID=7167 RepID=UPI0016418622|nr:POU domain, class 6, transcription factor 2-like isoform X2 [Anopheles albimanus]
MEEGGTDPENNNSSSAHCGMLGISMPCEGATGHDFAATVRKELEYANAIAAHYHGATVEKISSSGSGSGVGGGCGIGSSNASNDRVISYKIENRRKSENCSRSNSPFLNHTATDLDAVTCGRSSSSGSSIHNNNNNNTIKSTLLRNSQDKMSPLSMPTGPSSSATTSAAAAAAAVAAAQVHLNGTMQDMLNLQKLQSLAQLTGASVLAPGLGLPSAAPLLANSPLNLSLSSQSHSPVLSLGPTAPPLAAAAPQMPQLLLASGQIMQGIQGAQLLIPTSQGIATQTILTIPVGQQVISSMSSEALLQSLNFNSTLSDSLSSQAAQAAAAAAAASGANLFATPRDTAGTPGPGLLSAQLLNSAASHSMHQQHQQQQHHQQQEHSPKAALHYANHHHHHHHHHLHGEGGKLRSSGSSSTSSAVAAGTLASQQQQQQQQQQQIAHSLASSTATGPGRATPDTLRVKSFQVGLGAAGESPKRISLAASSPPATNLSRPASYTSCSSSSYEKSIPLKRALSPVSLPSNGHLQVNVQIASPRSPSDSAINRLGLSSSAGELIASKSKPSPASSSGSSLSTAKDLHPQTTLHGSVSPLQPHHSGSVGPSTATSASVRPSSCDLELIEQHHRSSGGEEMDLDTKPATVGSSAGAGQSLQKRPHSQSHHPHGGGGGGETSTSSPKLSPAGSARLSATHSDDDDDEETSNHEFLEEHPNELTINQTNCNVVDGIDLDDIKEFAKAFKLRRLSLGLTQTQVGQALSVTEGPAYSQSAICRFEKLDITPKSAQKIKPVLERWMKEAEESHSSRYKTGQNHVPDFIGVEPSKKRKRRTSFTPQALELLNGHFERNTHPSGTEITGLAHQLGYEREVIRIWFCNKRQALKNTVRMMSKSFKMENT